MKVRKTRKGNVKIKLNEAEAESLLRLVNVSHGCVVVGDHLSPSVYTQVDEYLVSCRLYDKLQSAGVYLG